MRSHYITAILLLLVLLVKAQPAIDLNRVYVLTQPVELKKCNIVGTLDNATEIALRGYEFKIDRVVESGLVIHFLKWKNKPDLNAKFYNTAFKSMSEEGVKPQPTPSAPDTYFLLPLAEFNKSIQKYGNAPFAVGVVVLPIRMRFSNGTPEDIQDKRYFDFEGAISVGLSVGANIKLDKSKFTARNALAFLGGFSLSSVGVDSFTTHGYLKTSTNSAAITTHLGILYQIDNLQIGVFSGIDFLAGELGKQWKYRNRPWFGVGMGFSIFKAKKTTDTQE
jgi:hypothetical protein